MTDTFYITTPIYYPSGKLQLGNTYTTVFADALARYNRLMSRDTYFLTGTDEHGLKIQQKAKAANQTEMQYLDQQIDDIKKLWELMDVKYDKFIRTTDPTHEEKVQHIFTKLLEQGDIYKGEYSGWYSVSDEEYFTETQLAEVRRNDKGEVIGGIAPSGHEVELVKEEAYFFKISKYADWLLEYYKSHSEFSQPESRMNEMIKNFIEPGLEDLAVTRTSFDWGVKVPNDPKHVIYVWIDALSNYITALGYDPKNKQQPDLYQKFWPANIQLVGKEIVRFHTIYWPIMLHALGLELPKQVLGHGWLVMKDGKMSKSKGNVIYPDTLKERYGLDAVRYYLLRAMPYGQDGVFTPEDFVSRLNFDLANDLGNLLNRTVSMINQYLQGRVPELKDSDNNVDNNLRVIAKESIDKFKNFMEEYKTADALEAVWELIRRSNKYIDENEPWTLNKNQDIDRLSTVMAHLTAGLRVIATLLQPVLTQAPIKIFAQLGLGEIGNINDLHFDDLGQGKVVEKPEPIFPRVDVEEEVKFISSLVEPDSHNVVEKKEDKVEEDTNLIEFDDFVKVEMKVVEIKRAEFLDNSDKLIKFTVDDGTSDRVILSGIRKWYSNPDELIGKKVLAVTNLKPRKMAGEISNGMLLASDTSDGNVILSILPDNTEPGARIN